MPSGAAVAGLRNRTVPRWRSHWLAAPAHTPKRGLGSDVMRERSAEQATTWRPIDRGRLCLEFDHLPGTASSMRIVGRHAPGSLMRLPFGSDEMLTRLTFG